MAIASGAPEGTNTQTGFKRAPGAVAASGRGRDSGGDPVPVHRAHVRQPEAILAEGDGQVPADPCLAAVTADACSGEVGAAQPVLVVDERLDGRANGAVVFACAGS